MRLKVYFGKVCAKHPELKGERSLTSRNCVECLRLNALRWSRKNIERDRLRSRKWRQKNAEYNKKRCLERYYANREHEIAVRRKNHQKEKACVA